AILNESLLINNKKTNINHILTHKDTIQHTIHIHEPSPIEIPIISVENEIIVVNKPAGIACHPTSHYNYFTVTKILEKEYGLLSCVNRLDLPTSGVLLLTRGVSDNYHTKMRSRCIKKIYIAKVMGDFKDQMVDKRIKSIPGKGNLVHEDGRECVTDFKKLFYKDGYSLVECVPFTGRTHQIRVHLQSIGFPIVNDLMYNTEINNNLQLTNDVKFNDLKNTNKIYNNDYNYNNESNNPDSKVYVTNLDKYNNDIKINKYCNDINNNSNIKFNDTKVNNFDNYNKENNNNNNNINNKHNNKENNINNKNNNNINNKHNNDINIKNINNNNKNNNNINKNYNIDININNKENNNKENNNNNNKHNNDINNNDNKVNNNNNNNNNTNLFNFNNKENNNKENKNNKHNIDINNNGNNGNTNLINNNNNINNNDNTNLINDKINHYNIENNFNYNKSKIINNKIYSATKLDENLYKNKSFVNLNKKICDGKITIDNQEIENIFEKKNEVSEKALKFILETCEQKNSKPYKNYGQFICLHAYKYIIDDQIYIAEYPKWAFW
ncbi:RNA pseudouridylate synthase domain containing protein 2, partial [Conglomerata obtusa]